MFLTQRTTDSKTRAEQIADYFADAGYKVVIVHTDINMRTHLQWGEWTVEVYSK